MNNLINNIINTISMNNDAYFPIRSNIAYFREKTDQPALINRIKQSILMHENLIFDFGVYGLLYNENGSLEFMDLEPTDYPEAPESEIKNLMAVAEFPDKTIPIIEEGIGNFYRSSFYPILNDLDLLEENFIKFISYEFTEKGKEYLEDTIVKTEALKNSISLPPVFRDNAFKNFHESIIVSNVIGTPLQLDSLHTSIIQNMANISVQQDKRLKILDTMLNTAENCINDCIIPDFSNYDTDGLLELRKDKSFQRFREKILDINNALIHFDESELEKIVMEEVIKETTSELQELAPTRPKLALSFITGLVGLIPGISEVLSMKALTYDTLKEAMELRQYENSWLAFILQYEG